MRRLILLGLLCSSVAGAQVVGSGTFSGSHGGGSASSVPLVANVPFQNAMAKAATAPVNVLIAGDSFTICDFTNCGFGPLTPSKRWAEQLRVYLQGLYGNGGTGMVPVVSSFGGLVSPQINVHAWTCTAGVTFNNALGPTQNSSGVNTAMADTSSCTFHDDRLIAWDKLVVYCGTIASSGHIDVVIDGGAPTAVCGTQTGPVTPVATTITSTSSTNHTVVMTSVGQSFLWGAQGLNGTAGVSVSDVGVSGAQSAAYSNSPTTEYSYYDLIPSGTQVFIYEIMTNDVSSAINTTTFQTNVQGAVTHELALASHPLVMLAIPPRDVVSLTDSFTAYQAAQRAVCTGNLDLNCVDMDAINGPYISTSGLWDLAGSAWPGGNSGVHPNDLLNTYEYQAISGALLNRYSAQP